MVRVLAVSDEVDESLWHDVSPRRGVELIVSCGDLPFEYLACLMQRLDVPLVFVPGNHDPDVGGYRHGRGGHVLRAGLPAEPPWPCGAVNADGRVVDVAGLRFAGLGGCLRYSDGPNQYSQGQQSRRATRVAASARWRRFRDGKEVDVIVAHAPPHGVGDRDDPAHQGFRGLRGLVSTLNPPLLLHGHIHPYGEARRDRQLGRTVVRNVVGHRVFEIEPAEHGGRARASRHAS